MILILQISLIMKQLISEIVIKAWIRESGFNINQINKLTIKIYSNLSNIKIHYHLKLGAPPLHRRFFIKLLENRGYIQTHCNNRRNTFPFACRQWYSYNNPGTLT